MQCLEKYRSKLVRDANRQLRVIAEAPDESAVHDFRVNLKRLTALYEFLGGIDDTIPFKRQLKPYRVLFKSLGNIRDAQIAIRLIEDLDAMTGTESGALVEALRTGIDRDYGRYREIIGDHRAPSIRLATIRAGGIKPAAISRYQPVYLESLLEKIFRLDDRTTASGWHRKRILLKRYRHNLDAFSLCSGQAADQRQLRQISMLEQLLGDWHDRVVTAELLQSLPAPAADAFPVVHKLKSQDRVLLGAAKLYLAKFARDLQVMPVPHE